MPRGAQHRAFDAVCSFLGASPAETRAALWSFTYFFFLLSGYYIIRPVRDAMGVAGGVGNLPWVFTAVFVVLLIAVPIFGVVVARLPRRRFVPVVYRFFAINLLVFAALIHLDAAQERVAQAFFVWVTVYNMFVVSVFWSVMADVFNSGQGKRLFGFIAAGGSVGALVGSWITGSLAEVVGLTALLCVSALMLEITVRCFRKVAQLDTVRPPEREAEHSAPLPEPAGEPAAQTSAEPAAQTSAEPAPIGGRILAGATEVARSPYLAGICFYLLCLATASTVLYFATAGIVEVAFIDNEARSAFFAVVDMITSGLTLLLQLVVTARVLRWLGVAVTLAIAPLLTIAGFIGITAVPALVTIVAFQVALRSTRYSITRPGREMLFTVVSREQKYKCKNFIDTAVYRGGDAASSWVYPALQALGLGLVGIATVMMPLMTVWLGVALLLGRHQEALARAGASRATLAHEKLASAPSAEATS